MQLSSKIFEFCIFLRYDLKPRMRNPSEMGKYHSCFNGSMLKEALSSE